jgi:hypothetical protein
MSDFDRAIDLARDEEYTPPPPTPGELPRLTPTAWTPDAPAPLAMSGPPPGLFVSAGVEDSAPAPLMTPQEQKQHADEAALIAKGGQFTGDRDPSWSQSHMTKDPPPRPAFGDAFEDFHNHVTGVQEDVRGPASLPGRASWHRTSTITTTAPTS